MRPVLPSQSMPAQRRLALVGALALTLCGSACSSARTGPDPVSVGVPKHPSLSGNLQIGFHPQVRLPRGGYYYAVVVLARYARDLLGRAPSCATSSDMRRTAYGHPQRDGQVTLTLTRARSAEGRWCAGGTYQGAVYAVPHSPPCSASYPCYGRSAESGGCFELSEGRRVCGVVVPPPKTEPTPPSPQPMPPATPYSFPGGLPKPIDRGTRVIARFEVRF
jgi:hypothetical protein